MRLKKIILVGLAVLSLCSIAQAATQDLESVNYNNTTSYYFKQPVPTQAAIPANILGEGSFSVASTTQSASATFPTGTTRLRVVANANLNYGTSAITNSASAASYLTANTEVWFYGTEAKLEAIYFIGRNTATGTVYYTAYGD